MNPASKEEPSKEQSAERLRLTLPKMTQHQVPVTPDNYAVWYRYTSGDNSDLISEIDQLIASKTTFNNQLNTDLFNKYASPCDINQFDKVKDELVNIMQDVTGSLQSAGNQTEDFGGTLDGLVKNVAKSSNLDDIKGLLTTLVSETQSVRQSQQLMFEHFESKTREIDLLQEELDRERKRATTDPLTGLANRIALFDNLDSMILDAQQGKPLSFLMVDIDHFKQVNDQYGHLIGDRVIRFVSKVMEKNIKGMDLAARFGGEEFAILLPNTGSKAAKSVAETIRTTVADAKLVRSDNKEPMDQITISIGVSTYRDGEDNMELINRADQALYESKHNGRNKVTLAGDTSDVLGAKK